MKIGRLNKSYNYMNSISSVAIINLLLAVTALLKDMFLASYLGTTYQADALLLAFFITDMLGNNLIGSAIGTACIPRFSSLYVRKQEQSLNRCVKNINRFGLALSAAIGLIVIASGRGIINFLGRGFLADTKELTLKLLYVLVITIVLYPTTAVGVARLQVWGRFKVSALAPVLFNFLFLIGIIYCNLLQIPVNKGVYYIAFSIIAGLIAMLFLIYGFRKRERLLAKSKEAEDENETEFQNAHSSSNIGTDLGNIIRVFVPYVFILFLSQGMLYVEKYLASGFETGSVAALNYGYRLSQFPVWVFVSAIGTVTFPMMSKVKEKGDLKELNQILTKAVWLTLVLTTPMVIILHILRVPIISILFLRGAFDINSINMTERILSGYSFAILGQSISAIGLRFLVSIGKTVSPFIIFTISSIVNVVFDFYLVKKVGLAGLGYGAAIGSIVNVVMILTAMRIDFRKSFKKKFDKLIKLAISNTIVVVLCFIYIYIWNEMIANGVFILKLAYGVAVAASCTVLYFCSVKYTKLI